jgi:hypothetical protein
MRFCEPGRRMPKLHHPGQARAVHALRLKPNTKTWSSGSYCSIR